MARRSGFTHTFASQRTPADIDATTFARTEASRVLKEASLDPLGVDVVVEASAAASAMLHGVALVRAGGTCAFAFPFLYSHADSAQIYKSVYRKA